MAYHGRKWLIRSTATVVLGLSSASALCGQSQLIIDLPNGEALRMVLIRPGTYLMGSSQSEIDSLTKTHPWLSSEHSSQGSSWGFFDEGPQHVVSITHPFYLSACEITQGQWRSLLDTEPWLDEARMWMTLTTLPTAASYPAAVSWFEAQQFVTVLNDLTSTDSFRLPTEAEWEYAARAGTSTPWSFGESDEIIYDYAVKTCGWSGISSVDCMIGRVGTKLPNPWGLYDMHGNVWEWVADWYSPTYYSESPRDDPTGPKAGGLRVLRSGSHVTVLGGVPPHKTEEPNGTEVRSANRVAAPPWALQATVGFRVARSVANSGTSAVTDRSWGEIKAQGRGREPAEKCGEP